MLQINKVKKFFVDWEFDKNCKISRFALYFMLKTKLDSIDEELVKINYLSSMETIAIKPLVFSISDN